MKSMMRPLVAAALATGLASFAIPAIAQKTSGASQMSAQEFVDHATAAGMFEIKSSQAVMADGGSKLTPEVRSFAEKMVSDHTAAGEKLKTIATSQNLSVPSALPKPEMAIIDKMKSAKDPVAAYDKAQVVAHTDAVSLFEDYAQGGKNQELKKFAMDTLPALKMHLDMAKKLPGEKA